MSVRIRGTSESLETGAPDRGWQRDARAHGFPLMGVSILGRRGPQPKSQQWHELHGSWRAKTRKRTLQDEVLERNAASAGGVELSLAEPETESLPPISGSLLGAVQNCGLSLAELAKLSGVSLSSLSRFSNGRADLTLMAVDKLAVVLGLALGHDPEHAVDGVLIPDKWLCE